MKIKFQLEDWAPGLWAGTEGFTFRIISVDLENRSIEIEFPDPDYLKWKQETRDCRTNSESIIEGLKQIRKLLSRKYPNR